MHRTNQAAAAIATALCLALLRPAFALENPAKGKALAEQWCSSCHLVTPDQSTASADAPPFMSIAKRSDEALARLAPFLTDPHPKMPNFSLSRQEISDLVAYIRSLKQ